MDQTTSVVKKIDWHQLRKQKQWLLKQEGYEANGLINLIDALQDAAFSDGLATEEELFGVPYP